MKLRIAEFQAKIEDNYVKEGNDRSALGVEMRHLKDAESAFKRGREESDPGVERVRQDARHVGRGDLGAVLEGSGLRKGHEYVVQSRVTREDGTRAILDVINLICRKAGVWWLIPRCLSSRTRSLRCYGK